MVYRAMTTVTFLNQWARLTTCIACLLFAGTGMLRAGTITFEDLSDILVVLGASGSY
jgi:hypothetical protein